MANTVNSSGMQNIGNRYFGSKSAAEVARTYSRLQSNPNDSSNQSSANRAAEQAKELRNGLPANGAEAKDKTSSSQNIYARGTDILQRMADLADEASNITISILDRAKLDAEFQQLKKKLQDNGIGATPTAAAQSNPSAAKLENLQLIDDVSNLLSASAAVQASLKVATGQNLLNQQRSAKEAQDLEQAALAKDTAYQRRQLFSDSAQAEQLRQSLETTGDAQRFVIRANAYANGAAKPSIAGILNLLA